MAICDFISDDLGTVHHLLLIFKTFLSSRSVPLKLIFSIEITNELALQINEIFLIALVILKPLEILIKLIHVNRLTGIVQFEFLYFPRRIRLS